MLDVARELAAEGRIEDVLELVARLVERNSTLEKLIAQARAQYKNSEGVSTEQLHLLLEQLPLEKEEAIAAADKQLRDAAGVDEAPDASSPTEQETRPPKQPPVRRKFPDKLRRVDNLIPVPEAERRCPGCGAERKCIGHDVSEVLDLIPAEVVVRRDIREKLACEPCDGELTRAPLGDKPVAGGRMGTTLVSHLVVDKYRDGLPLHRQKERFGRMGADLPISTLADQVTWATELLRPVWRALFAKVLGSHLMHLDGTSLPVLDRNAVNGIRLGSLWGYVGDDHGALSALYLYASTGKKVGQREGELGPEDVLELRRGFTVADASSIFDASFKRPELIECGCNMHARRYFTKALDAGDLRAALPIAAFKKLYDIEEEIRSRDEAAKRLERQARSKPLYDELLSWCRIRKPVEPPSSALGKAISYLDNHHEALMRFLEHGAVPIDNGVVERLHVRAALTRKNYLFAGSDAGAERAAIAYSIIGSCILADVNPVEYLADVLPRLARGVRLADVGDYLPLRWKALREQSTAIAAA